MQSQEDIPTRRKKVSFFLLLSRKRFKKSVYRDMQLQEMHEYEKWDEAED